jgi:hypothetical protein
MMRYIRSIYSFKRYVLFLCVVGFFVYIVNGYGGLRIFPRDISGVMVLFV